jgi:hypothetical protein
MKLRPDHIEPPAFARVCQAFQMACHLPSANALQLRIGLLDEDGALAAEGNLDGYRQVAYFTEQLRALGYEGRLLDGGDRMHDCDVLYSAPSRTPTRYQVGRRAWQVVHSPNPAFALWS